MKLVCYFHLIAIFPIDQAISESLCLLLIFDSLVYYFIFLGRHSVLFAVIVGTPL